jgi:predicted GTPase
MGNEEKKEDLVSVSIQDKAIVKFEETNGKTKTGKVIHYLNKGLRIYYNIDLAVFTGMFIFSLPILAPMSIAFGSAFIISCFFIRNGICDGIELIIEKIFTEIDITIKTDLVKKIKEILMEINKDNLELNKKIKNNTYLLVKNVITSENLPEILNKKFNELKKDLTNSQNKEFINVLVLGQTQIGKSTLINALGGNAVVKDNGKSCTMHFDDNKVESDKIDYIDSRGFDMAKPTYEHINDIKKELEKRNESNCQYVDVIYYCINKAGSFQNEEIDLISELLKIYPSEIFPFIFVITKIDYPQEIEKWEKNIKNSLTEREIDTSKIKIVGVRAKVEDYEVNAKIYGIKELKDLTINMSKDNKESPFFGKIKNQLYDKIYGEPLKFSINSDNFELFQNVIVKTVNYYSFNRLDKKLSKENHNLCKEICKDFEKLTITSLNKIKKVLIDSIVKNEQLKDSSKTKKDILQSIDMSKIERDTRENFIMKFANILNLLIEENFLQINDDIFNNFVSSIINNN